MNKPRDLGFDNSLLNGQKERMKSTDSSLNSRPSGLNDQKESDRARSSLDEQESLEPAKSSLDDDDLKLSETSLAALNEFLGEEINRQKQLEAVKSGKMESSSMDLFKEDWNLSQFWYSESTADLFANQLIENADKDTWIALISAPSVYAALNRIQSNQIPTNHIYLFEYDDRFQVICKPGTFVHYDLNRPMELPIDLKNKFDRILVDPPFLNVDTQTKAAITVRWLLKKDRNDKYKTIVSTGERMAEIVSKVYPDVKMTDFFPEHSKGLSNEFRCYTSYQGKAWKWVEE